MFESLKDGLQSALKSLRGKGKLSESNMRDGLGIVEQSLIEADVSYSVVKDFMAKVSEKALGQRVLLSLDPSEQLIGIVYEELVQLLGPEAAGPLHLRKDVTVLMLCGLQGSGKTTTCGKLAHLLLQGNVRPMLVAADLQRPAAIEQLHVLGEQLGLPVYSETGAKDPVKVCQAAVEKARAENAKVVILDTAGRLAIDQELMDQLVHIDRRVQPDQVFLVVDGMTGQDAVNSAKAFNEALELDGVIMTKLDGDARGGALLSVKHVTGVPIKYIGTGEHLDALEPFRPDGMAARILGQTDVVELVRQAQLIVDDQEREQLEQKLADKSFTLDDFKDQISKMAKPGLIQKMLGLLGGPMSQLTDMMENEDTAASMKRTVGIINSMTLAERKNTKVIDPSRRSRIANGAGVAPQEVNELIKQYERMKPVMEGMAGKSAGERMQAMQELQQGGMFDPGGQGPKSKKGTGKRLSPKEKAKLKKIREKEKRKKKRETLRGKDQNASNEA